MGYEKAQRLEKRSQASKPGCILQPRLHNETRGDNRRAAGQARAIWRPRSAAKSRRPRPPGLATEPAQADRFSKARSARSASLLEDYTELIADLIAANGEARTTDIARRMGVAHPTASKTIARLKREGLARAKPYRGIFLTEAGAAMAKSARERHRLVVDLLIADWRAARGGRGRRRGHRALRLRHDAQRLRGVPARPRRALVSAAEAD